MEALKIPDKLFLVANPFALAAVAVFGTIVIALSTHDIALTGITAALAALLLFIGIFYRPKRIGDAQYLPTAPSASKGQFQDVAPSRERENPGLGKLGGLNELETIYFLHLKQRSEKFQLEQEDGSAAVEYFVNLMEAVHMGARLDRLSEELAKLIRANVIGDPAGIVGPKRGNPLLIRAVADRLGVPSAYVKSSFPLAGSWVEGMIVARPGNPVVLVDDVASDSRILVECVHRLREAGYEVSKAFVLIDRQGDAGPKLAEMNVRLHALSHLNDADLRLLENRAKTVIV